jgi:hypothetical protein
VAAWPELSEAARAEVLAIVRARSEVTRRAASSRLYWPMLVDRG